MSGSNELSAAVMSVPGTGTGGTFVAEATEKLPWLEMDSLRGMLMAARLLDHDKCREKLRRRDLLEDGE